MLSGPDAGDAQITIQEAVEQASRLQSSPLWSSVRPSARGEAEAASKMLQAKEGKH